MDTLYGAMMQTAENSRLKVISDDCCCKLLAWLSVYGGATEAVVSNNMLYVDLMVSKQRLNIDGGKVPNAGLVAVMNGYVKEIRANKADWIEEIEKKYKVVSRL